MSNPALRLLIVDDEKSVREPLAERLTHFYGYEVKTAADGQEALRLLAEPQGQCDVALVDQILIGKVSGVDLLREIKSRYPDTQVIMFTGWEKEMEKEGVNILRLGAYRYFKKPYDFDELALTIQFAAEEKQVRQERQYLEALVKVSQGLTATTQQAEQLSLAWDFVREQLDVSTFFIGLLSPDGKRIYFPLVYDQDQQINLPDILLSGKRRDLGLAGYVVKTGEEILWSTLDEMKKVCKARKIAPIIVNEPSVSGFCLPLRVGEQVRGVFSAQSYQSHIFTSSLQNALRSLGNQLTVAMVNSRLFAEAEQGIVEARSRTERLKVMQDLARTVNSSLELQDILTRACQSAVEFFRADHSGLVLFDDECEHGTLEAEYPDLKARGLDIPLRGVPDEERVIETRQPLLIENVQGRETLGPVREIMLRMGIRSILIVPVLGKDGKPIGSFSLDAMQDSRRFLEEEIQLCTIFASYVAVAIENSRLFNEAREGREYLRSLYQASNAIISLRHPNEVLQNIVDTACSATNAWRGVTLLVDESQRPRILASSGFDQKMDVATSVRDYGISRQVMQSGQPRFIPDVEADAEEVHPAMLEQGVGAAACLPLPLLGRNIGVLWIHFNEKRAFSETERQALQLYANQSAIAYDNARRVQELEQLERAAEAMAKTDEWKDALRQIAESAKGVLGADYTLVWPYDFTRKVFFPEDLVADNIPPDLLEEFRSVEPEVGSTTRHVLERGYAIVEDLDTDPAAFVGDSTRMFLQKLEVKAFQGIRLDVADEPLGVLYTDYRKARGFGEEDRRILEHFAHQAALTLKKARLFEQVKRTREAARVVARAGALGNLNETLNEVVKGAKDVLGCDVATLYTFDEESQRFVHYKGVGYYDPENMRPPADILETSSLWRILRLQDKLYHPSEDALNDDLLKGGFVQKEGVESALGVQLHFETRRVGVMFINYRTPHRFNNDEIEDALHFANQAAVAIRNAQLHERTKRQAETLEGLYKAGKAVTGILTLNEILESVAEQAWRLVGQSAGYYTSIRLIEDEIAKVVAAYPPEELAQSRATIPEIDLRIGVNGRFGVTGRAIRTGKSQLVDDVSTDNDYLSTHLETFSELATPIKLGEQVIGVINVESPELRAFGENDEHTLESLASYAAIAINNAQLYERTSEQAETLRGLYEAGKSITSTLALDKVLTHIAEQALRIVGANPLEGCFSHIALREGDKLRFIAGWPLEILDDLRQNVGEIDLQNDAQKGIAGLTVITGQSQNEPEVSNDPNWIPLRKGVNIHSQLSVPLKIGERIIGVLSIEHPKPAAFSDEDVKNVELLAAQASIAIENARRVAQIESMRTASEDMARATNVQEILSQIVASARKIMGADGAAIWQYDNLRESFIHDGLAYSGILEKLSDKFQWQLPQPGGIAYRILEQGMVNIDDVISDDSTYLREQSRASLIKAGVSSFIGVALKAGEENLGVLYVDYSNPRSFGDEELQTVKTFANQVALALKNARFLEQQNRARTASRVVAKLTVLGDLNKTLESIVFGAKEVLRCDVVTLYTYNQETDEFSFPPAMAGVHEQTKVSMLSGVTKHSVVQKILVFEKPHVAEDASSDPIMRGPFVLREKIESSVGIPLRVGDRRVGVMFVNFRSLHRFTRDELTNIELFANQAAVAIWNAQLHDETRKRAEALEGLYKAGKAVTGLLPLNEILERIAEQAWHLVGRRASYTNIRLVENDAVKIVAAYPPEELAQSRAKIPEIDLMEGVNGRFGVTGRAIRTGDSQLVDDVSSDNDYLPSHPQTRSELAVPIKLGERAIGVINVESPETRAFGKDDRHALTSLASYAAIAINNAQLYDRTKGQAETLRGLYEAGKAITSTLALDEVLTHIAEQALYIVGTNPQEGCFSHIALREGDKLRFIAGYPLEILDDLRQNVGEIDLQKDAKMGIDGLTVITGKSENVSDVSNDSNWIPLREGINVHSQLSVPLKIGERIIGVLSIEHPKPAAFSDEDVKNIESLAAQAAVAIQNAQQYGELKKTKGLVGTRTALAWMGMVSSTWRHAITRDTVTIRDQIKLLRGDLTSLSESGAINKRLNMIERLSNRILEKPITAPLSAEEGAISVPLNKLIRERVNSLWLHELYKPVKLDLDFALEDSATVRASPEWLQRAMDILIDNAIDALQGLPEPHLAISTRHLGYQAEILIKDNGHGIPAEVRERLFQEPIQKTQGEKGLGMGLLFAQTIVQTYGGEIHVSETSPMGTTMVVSLPLEG